MTQVSKVSDASLKLGLSFGLITTLLVLRGMLSCCKSRNDYTRGDIENGYRNMNEEKKSMYVILFFGMMYLMSIVNYLTEVIFDVANNRN